MFHVINLNVRQLRQTNDSASIGKCAKERFCNSKMLKKVQQEVNKNAVIIEEFESVNNLFLSA